MTDAFPRKPAPRHPPPRPEEIRQAREEFALHIPSLFSRRCLAHDCDGEWPCAVYRRAVQVLERAGEIDIDGQLRHPHPCLPGEADPRL